MNDNNSANKLCTISLLLMYAFPAAVELLTVLANGISEKLGSFVSGAASALIIPAVIAAFIIVIVAKVKYPDNKFAKVLLIVYIVQLILSIILLIIGLIFMVALFNSCMENCSGFFLR